MRHQLLKFAAFAGLLPLSSFAQTSPGGVSTTNLSVWLKATDLPGGPVTSWPSNGSSSNSFSMTPVSTGTPTATTTPLFNFGNYNRVIDFMANTDADNIGLGYTPTSIDFLNNNSYVTASNTLFIVSQIPDSTITVSTTGQHIFNYKEVSGSSGDGYQIRRLPSGVVRNAIGSSNSYYATTDWDETFQPTIITSTGGASSSASSSTMKTILNNEKQLTKSASSSSSYRGIYIATRRNQSSGVYQGSMPGYISEVIIFDENLSNTDIAKVQSYLALKNGITLVNNDSSLNADANYYASSGAVVFAADANYGNDIIGIVNETTAEDFVQKQSHSISDNQRIYVGTLASDNINNVGTITNDISYVVMGRNNDALDATSTEYPSGQGILSRINREWKIQKTNFDDNFSIDIDCSSNPLTVAAPNLRLLVDADGDFSNASIFSGDDLTFSYNSTNNILTIANISNSILPSNSTSYFTIGIGNASDPLPVSYVLLDAAYIGNNTADISFSPRGAEDIASFNIQKAVDGKKWHDIASFSNSDADKYQFEDKNFTSEAYYRIAAKERTGDVLYSPVKYLSNPIDKTDNIIYPNPAEDYLYVSLNSNQSKMLKIVTSTGRDVTGSIEVQLENDLVKLNIKKLPAGIYYLSADGIKYPFLKK